MTVGRSARRTARAHPMEGNRIMTRFRAANRPAHPAMGSRPPVRGPAGGPRRRWVRLWPVLRLPRHLAASRHRLVVRLADPAVPVAEARRGHRPRETRPRPDPRPDPRRIRAPDLPRRPQRGRGLGQGPQVQERLPAVLRDSAQQRPVPDREDRRQGRPGQDLPPDRPVPVDPLPLQVHRVLRRVVLVGLPDPVQPPRPPRRSRLHRQGLPPTRRRPTGGDVPVSLAS